MNALWGKLSNSKVGAFFAAELFVKAQPFLVTLVLVNWMSPDQFGSVAFIVTVSGIVSVFAGYGFGVMVARESHFRSTEEFGQLMSASWLISILVALALIFAVFLLKQVTTILDTISAELIVFSFLIGFVNIRQEIIGKYLVALGKVKKYISIEFLRGAVTAGLSIILVYSFPFQAIEYRLFSITTGTFVALLLGIALCWTMYKSAKPSLTALRDIAVYGSKVFPQAVSNWVKLGADKIIIAVSLGMSDLGAYAFIFSICSIALILGKALNNSFVRISLQLYKQNDIARVRKVRNRYIAYSMVFTTSLFVLIELVRLFYWPSGYDAELSTIVLLLFSFQSQIIYLLYAKYFLFDLKIGELGLVNLFLVGIYVASLLSLDIAGVGCIAFCYFIYNFLLAAYVAMRAIFAEKKMKRRPVNG